MESDWKMHGPDFNAWCDDFYKLAEALESVKDAPWWIMDMRLKYLTIRMDTRDNGFLLFIDNGENEREKISPSRVLAAIEKYHERFRPAVPNRTEGQHGDVNSGDGG